MSILTVRQLTAQIKDAVESGFPYVWVRGEVTNVSRPSSGHIYFSLKDENALLQAVWFKEMCIRDRREPLEECGVLSGEGAQAVDGFLGELLRQFAAAVEPHE